jgi:Ni/Co efflux regulator RcnB
LKKLLIALGLGSALLITPALAQTDQTAPAPGAAAPAGDQAAPAKPKAHHHHKAKHHAMKKSKAKKEAAPADANAPK